MKISRNFRKEEFTQRRKNMESEKELFTHIKNPIPHPTPFMKTQEKKLEFSLKKAHPSQQNYGLSREEKKHFLEKN